MRAAILGAAFGLVAIWLGLFAGLQVHVLLGQQLVFPMILIATFTGTPLMMMPMPLWLLAIVAQCFSWALIFWLFGRLRELKKSR